MLKLAKGTHILGLTKTGSHGTISQYFVVVLVATQKGVYNDPPIQNGKKKSKELSEQIYGKLFTQIIVHFVRPVTPNSRDPPPKIKATTKHYYV